jgi:hypothetical protein
MYNFKISVKMKLKIIPFSVAICLLLLTSCTDEILLDEDKPNKLKSSFAAKPSVLKLSFVEESVRRTDFPKGKAIDLGLTFLEEPKSE